MSGPLDSGDVRPLPEKANLEHLKNQAKQLLKQLRVDDAQLQLADAQYQLAQSYGYSSWRALKEHVDGLSRPQQKLPDEEVSRIVTAVEKGDLATVQEMLGKKPDWLSYREGDWKQTLLHKAAWRNQFEVAQYLVQQGADVNARCVGDNAVPLHFAAEQGNLEMAKLLVEAGSDVVGEGDEHELGILGWATCFERYHPHVVDYLLSHGSRHNIYSAVACNDVKTVEALLEGEPGLVNRRLSDHDAGATPLHIAVKRQSDDVARVLLEFGADPSLKDQRAYTPLAMAAQGGYTVLIEMLRPLTEELDPASMLWMASREDALEMLKQHPEWTEPEGYLDQMLAGACHSDSLERVKHLVSLGARPAGGGKVVEWAEDVTPLHMAASNNRRELCEYLLEQGADPSRKDGSYDSPPWGWAYHFGHKALGDWLKAEAEARSA